jgi:hypothetical protein
MRFSTFFKQWNLFKYCKKLVLLKAYEIASPGQPDAFSCVGAAHIAVVAGGNHNGCKSSKEHDY